MITNMYNQTTTTNYKTTNESTDPVLLDENVSSDAENQSVEMTGVEGQCVIVVKTIDLNVLQAHLIVGKDGIWIHRVVRDHWNQVWSQKNENITQS